MQGVTDFPNVRWMWLPHSFTTLKGEPQQTVPGASWNTFCSSQVLLYSSIVTKMSTVPPTSLPWFATDRVVWPSHSISQYFTHGLEGFASTVSNDINWISKGMKNSSTFTPLYYIPCISMFLHFIAQLHHCNASVLPEFVPLGPALAAWVPVSVALVQKVPVSSLSAFGFGSWQVSAWGHCSWITA